MADALQQAWIKAAKRNIAKNPNIYGRGTSAPSNDAYLNFIDKTIVQKLERGALRLTPGNYNSPLMVQFINGALDIAIGTEESSDMPMPIGKNAALKIPHSLKEALNAGFDI
jgi:hypothetical protein